MSSPLQMPPLPLSQLKTQELAAALLENGWSYQVVPLASVKSLETAGITAKADTLGTLVSAELVAAAGPMLAMVGSSESSLDAAASRTKMSPTAFRPKSRAASSSINRSAAGAKNTASVGAVQPSNGPVAAVGPTFPFQRTQSVVLFRHHLIGPGCISLYGSGNSWTGYIRTRFEFKVEQAELPYLNASARNVTILAVQVLLRSYFMSINIMKAIISEGIISTSCRSPNTEPVLPPKHALEALDDALCNTEELVEKIVEDVSILAINDKLAAALSDLDSRQRQFPGHLVIDIVAQMGLSDADEERNLWNLMRPLFGIPALDFLNGSPYQSRVFQDLNLVSKAPLERRTESIVLKPGKRDDTKRAQLLNELVVTERNFINSITMLENFFNKPARENPGQWGLTSTHLASKTFPSVTKIIEIHTALLEDLVANQQSLSQIALAIKPHLNNLVEPYIQYVKTHKVIGTFKQEGDRTTRRVETAEREAEKFQITGGGVSLNSLQIAPIQRIPRIANVFAGLVAATSLDDPDYQTLYDAAIYVDYIVRRIDEAGAEEDSRKFLFQLDQNLQTGGKLAGAGVRYIAEVRVQELNRQMQTEKDSQTLILFNNGIVVMRHQSRKSMLGKLMFRPEDKNSWIDIAHLEAIPMREQDFYLFTNSDRPNESQMFGFRAESSEERDEFLRMLRHTLVCRHHGVGLPKAPAVGDNAPASVANLYAERYGDMDIYYNVTDHSKISARGSNRVAMEQPRDMICILVNHDATDSRNGSKAAAAISTQLKAYSGLYNAVCVIQVSRDGSLGYLVRTQKTSQNASLVVPVPSNDTGSVQKADNAKADLLMHFRNVALLKTTDAHFQTADGMHLARRFLEHLYKCYCPTPFMFRKTSIKSAASNRRDIPQTPNYMNRIHEGRALVVDTSSQASPETSSSRPPASPSIQRGSDSPSTGLSKIWKGLSRQNSISGGLNQRARRQSTVTVRTAATIATAGSPQEGHSHSTIHAPSRESMHTTPAASAYNVPYAQSSHQAQASGRDTDGQDASSISTDRRTCDLPPSNPSLNGRSLHESGVGRSAIASTAISSDVRPPATPLPPISRFKPSNDLPGRSARSIHGVPTVTAAAAALTSASQLHRKKTLIARSRAWLAKELTKQRPKSLQSGIDASIIDLSICDTVFYITEFIERCGINQPGVYRGDGLGDVLAGHLLRDPAGAILTLDQHTVDQATTAFKLYLQRRLPGGILFPEPYHSAVLKCAEFETADAELVPTFVRMFEDAEPEYRRLLHLVLRHWRRQDTVHASNRMSDNSHTNKMGAPSIASTVVPYVLGNASHMEQIRHDQATVALECMIWNYDVIFSAEEDKFQARFAESPASPVAVDSKPASQVDDRQASPNRPTTPPPPAQPTPHLSYDALQHPTSPAKRREEFYQQQPRAAELFPQSPVRRDESSVSVAASTHGVEGSSGGRPLLVTRVGFTAEPDAVSPTSLTGSVLEAIAEHDETPEAAAETQGPAVKESTANAATAATTTTECAANNAANVSRLVREDLVKQKKESRDQLGRLCTEIAVLKSKLSSSASLSLESSGSVDRPVPSACLNLTAGMTVNDTQPRDAAKPDAPVPLAHARVARIKTDSRAEHIQELSPVSCTREQRDADPLSSTASLVLDAVAQSVSATAIAAALDLPDTPTASTAPGTGSSSPILSSALDALIDAAAFRADTWARLASPTVITHNFVREVSQSITGVGIELSLSLSLSDEELRQITRDNSVLIEETRQLKKDIDELYAVKRSLSGKLFKATHGDHLSHPSSATLTADQEPNAQHSS
ncbi:hypothetical protein BC831DRAFT_437765 [Entophlyctis helioformis]|nr:hypothetical protein BC831DRAFT_437765 [Entophlyctis helioformis]